MTPLCQYTSGQGGWGRGMTEQAKRVVRAIGWAVFLRDAQLQGMDRRLAGMGFARCEKPVLKRCAQTVTVTFTWFKPGQQHWYAVEFQQQDWADWWNSDFTLHGRPHRQDRGLSLVKQLQEDVA